MASESLVYRILADNKDLQKKLNSSKKQLGRFQNQSNQIGRQIRSSLTSMFAVGTVAAFGRELVRTTKDYDAQAKAIAQVEQAVISTGGAANKTLLELTKTASALQNNTLFGDEDILQNATAQLLTFTNIAGDQFDRTQMAALDLATRLDGDLKSASIQLGKALNDPVANLSALSRSGIQFSKEQTAVIKQLANTNRLAEAQTIILDELANQYGGSAEAAAQAGTGGWTQLANTFGDLREEIGELIAENSASKGLSAWFKDITEDAIGFTRALNSQLSGWDKFKLSVAKALSGINPGMATYAASVEAVGNALKDQEDQVRSEEAAQKAAVVARQRQVDAINAQAEALARLQAAFRGGARQSLGLGNEFDVEQAQTGPLQISNEGFEASKEMLAAKYADINAFILSQGEMLNATMRDSVSGAIGGFADGIATGGIEQALNNIAIVFAEGISRIGDQLITYGVTMLAAKKALANPFTNPAVAIAAGIAAKVAASALRGAIQSNSANIASGGGAGGGGGSGSFQNNVQGQSVTLGGEFKIKGRDLVLAINENQRTNSRLQG